MADEHQPTWEERVAELREQYDDVLEESSMGGVLSTLGDTATEIAGLPGEITALRERGYAFAGYLERKAEVLRDQWDEIREQVQDLITRELERVQRQRDELGRLWKRLETADDDDSRERTFKLIEMGVGQMSGELARARERIEGLYGEVPGNVTQTEQQLRTITRYMDLADEATVDWHPTEALFMANDGEWVQTGKDKQDPDGILYLTDQRLIFEQKEKVGGRLGFGGEQVQQVLFAIPVGAITEVTAEKKGMLGGIDLINLTLSEGDYAEMTVEVKGGVQAGWYVQQLNRVISGEIEKERAIPVDEAAAEAVREAPTACPTCGATLPALVRGMTELTCQYCGTVVRV